MSAGPAIRTVSAQACRQCRKEQLQNASGWSSSRRFSSSPAPTASTSTATPATNFINRLRFEVGQANPSLASTWRSLNAVHDQEPAKLSPDLVRQTIPILQKHKKPSRSFPRVSPGPQYRAALAEEAEALYMRYRFVASRLRETGSEPQSVAQILYWLQALKALSYAPAAWRIWKDALEQARQDGFPVAKQISTLVLVVTAKWLFVLAEHTPSPTAIAEARKEADTVLAYLESNGQVDGTIASLKIRIIKHSSRYPEFAKAVKATFGLDLDMPCAPPGLASKDNIRTVDKHSHNSILSALENRPESFSRMMSVFESLAYPLEAADISPVQTADQNSFFSSNFDWFAPRESAEVATVGDSPNTDSAETSPERPLAEISESAEVEKPTELQISLEEPSPDNGDSVENIDSAEVVFRPAMKIVALNTRTFEIMIESALKQSSHEVARHYMLEMLEAWEQERQRLRASHAELAAYTLPTSIYTDEATGGRPIGRAERANTIIHEPARPNWTQIWQIDTLGPAIGPSIHAISRIYDELAGDWVSGLQWLKPLGRLVEDVKHVLDFIRDDIRFWTDILDKQQILAEAFTFLPPEQRSIHAALEEHRNRVHATAPDSDSFTGYQNLPLNTQLHLLILRKIEAELNDIHYEMHDRHRHAAAGRYIRFIMNELKGEREIEQIGRLVNAIRRSEAWCRADEAADEQRTEAIMGLNTLSYARKSNKVQKMRMLAAGRRQSVRRAILRAKRTLANLQRITEVAEPTPQAPVEAVPNRRLSSQLQDARKVSASGGPEDVAAVQPAPASAPVEVHGDLDVSSPKPASRRIRVQLGQKETLTSSGAASHSDTTVANTPR